MNNSDTIVCEWPEYNVNMYLKPTNTSLVTKMEFEINLQLSGGIITDSQKELRITLYVDSERTVIDKYIVNDEEVNTNRDFRLAIDRWIGEIIMLAPGVKHYAIMVIESLKTYLTDQNVILDKK